MVAMSTHGMVIIVIAGLALGLIWQFVRLKRNLRRAREIGLPIVILPWYTGTVAWFILSPVVTPLMKLLLPDFITRGWIRLIPPFWTYNEKHAPFVELGDDTFISVAPGGITFHTCSPGLISEIGVRSRVGRGFGKPEDIYEVMNTFGPNIVSTNGPLWRHQRKILAPLFNGKTHARAFEESVHQTRSLLQLLSESQSSILTRKEDFEIRKALRILSFNVVARETFGERVEFPGIGGEERRGKGHQLGLGEAMLCVVEGLKWIFVVPKVVLEYAPSKFMNKLSLSLKEMGVYLDEGIEERRKMIKNGETLGRETSVLSTLVDSTLATSLHNGEVISGLNKEHIIGNIFNTVFAGHETTSTALYYSILNLAINPDWQKRMQQEIDVMFGDRDPESWVYSEDMGLLFMSSVDAVLCETLRLYAPNAVIPKHTPTTALQIIKYQDKELVVPPNTRILILPPSTHSNPNYWPHSPSEPLTEFHPSRWFITPENAARYNGSTHNSNSLTPKIRSPPSRTPTPTPSGSKFSSSPPMIGNRQPTPSTPSPLQQHPTSRSQSSPGLRFFKPAKGAFIPWSIGARDCIGRMFSQIEILIALVVIFREWNVELARKEGGEGFEEAKERAMKHMREGMVFYTTMQLGEGLVDVRFVRREEGRI